MRAAIFCIGAALSLTACGSFERDVAKFKGHSQQCVDGVMYLQFASGATVKYRPDGQIWTCGKESSGS
jgi:hypothetical protein